MFLHYNFYSSFYEKYIPESDKIYNKNDIVFGFYVADIMRLSTELVDVFPYYDSTLISSLERIQVEIISTGFWIGYIVDDERKSKNFIGSIPECIKQLEDYVNHQSPYGKQSSE